MFDSHRPFARSIVAVFCAALAIGLMGATATSVAPTPPPNIPPTTLVVFPFRVADGVDASIGAAYSSTLVKALSTLGGGLKVVAGDATTAPESYLHIAKVDGADYYLIGHVAPPLHGAAAVIQQLVSEHSGTVVWSQTAYIASDTDVTDQAPIVRNALATYVMRGYAAILAAPIRTAPPPTPAPVKKGAAPSRTAPNGPLGPDNLPNEAYGFSSKPTAPPKVYASASKPARFVVLKFTGDARPQVRAYTETSLIAALKHHGQTVAEGDPQTTEFPIVRGPDICKDTGAGYLVFGSVTGTQIPPTVDNNFAGWTDAYLSVGVYDCVAQKYVHSAKPLHGGGGVWNKAVDNVTNAAVTAYLLKIPTVAEVVVLNSTRRGA